MSDFLIKNFVIEQIKDLEVKISKTSNIHEAEYKEMQSAGTLDPNTIYFVDDMEGGGMGASVDGTKLIIK